MTITKTTEGKTAVLCLAGWLDTQSAPELGTALEALAPDTEDLELDLSALVSRAVYDFCAGTEPFDDMAVLALIRREPAPEWQKIPVALSSFDTVKKAVFETAGVSPEVRRALLACDEALANIVRYSGAAELSFRCEKKEGLLCVAFSDDGVAFDPTKLEMEEKDFDMLDSGGMGLNLIRQTAASMRYERAQGRNVFTLCFKVQDRKCRRKHVLFADREERTKKGTLDVPVRQAERTEET